jgi:glucose-1-phosphate thymidylyltransferase
MKILILAAGYGTRLAAIAKDTPKPLLPINGTPMLDLIIDEISQISGISEYVVVTNNKFFGNFQKWQESHPKFKSKIRIVNDGTNSNDDRLGSVGDMRFVWDREKELDDWLVVGGDNLFDFDLTAFIAMARSKAPAVTVGVYDIKDITQAHLFGILALDKNGKVVSFEEKPKQPKSTLVTMCFYHFPKASVGHIHDYFKASSAADAAGGYIKWLSENKEVYGFEFQGTWYDIGSVESYYEAQKQFKK